MTTAALFVTCLADTMYPQVARAAMTDTSIGSTTEEE